MNKNKKAAIRPTAKRITNVSFDQGVYDAAQTCMQRRLMSNMTEYLSSLVRADWERLGSPPPEKSR